MGEVRFRGAAVQPNLISSSLSASSYPRMRRKCGASGGAVSRSRGAIRPRFAQTFLALKSEGAGNAGCALHPRSRVQMHKENAHEHTGQRRQSDIPCAMVLRLMPRSPRRRIRLVTVIGGLRAHQSPVGLDKTSADLTSATDARTTQFCRTLQHRSSARRFFAHRQSPPCEHLRARRCRVHRIPSRVRDDRDTPLMWDETAADIEAIWYSENQNIFSYGTGQPKSHQI